MATEVSTVNAKERDWRSVSSIGESEADDLDVRATPDEVGRRIQAIFR